MHLDASLARTAMERPWRFNDMARPADINAHFNAIHHCVVVIVIQTIFLLLRHTLLLRYVEQQLCFFRLLTLGYLNTELSWRKHLAFRAARDDTRLGDCCLKQEVKRGCHRANAEQVKQDAVLILRVDKGHLQKTWNQDQ